MDERASRPIGVFDSGVGGLTVLKELKARLPKEQFLYLGDTARLPYGNKSPQTITRYAFECAVFLMRKGIKMLVVACNTATSQSGAELSRFLRIPVHGVIEPGAAEGVAVTKSGRIGVIGTLGTARSHAYEKAIHTMRPECEVLEVACPLFVPIVEEGLLDGEVARIVARRYLEPLEDFDADTVILGCTHYPLLEPIIKEVMGERVTLVDSAVATAKVVEWSLDERKLRRHDGTGSIAIYLSDVQPHFRRVAEACLQAPIESLEIVRPDL